MNSIDRNDEFADGFGAISLPRPRFPGILVGAVVQVVDPAKTNRVPPSCDHSGRLDVQLSEPFQIYCGKCGVVLDVITG